MYDFHMHLERGGLNLAYLRRFLDRAQEVGVVEIGVTEHMYRFREAKDILWTERIAERCLHTVGEYAVLIDQVKSLGLPVCFGLEVDYVPGKEREIARVLRMFPLDYTIGSLHWLGDWAFDLNPDAWEGRDVGRVYRQYYETLARAAESGLFDIIGHAGNIAYFGNRPDEGMRVDLEDEFLERVSHLPVVMELNSGGLLRPAKELFPRPRVAKRIGEMGLAVSTGADAHRPDDVGHGFPSLYNDMRKWGFAGVCTFESRRRVTHPLTASGQ